MINETRRFVNVDESTGVGIDVIVTNHDEDENILYEETVRYEELDDEEIRKINARENNLEDYLRRDLVGTDKDAYTKGVNDRFEASLFLLTGTFLFDTDSKASITDLWSYRTLEAHNF